jgi:hypothetical protein
MKIFGSWVRVKRPVWLSGYVFCEFKSISSAVNADATFSPLKESFIALGDNDSPRAPIRVGSRVAFYYPSY